jgi:hypothetical protein
MKPRQSVLVAVVRLKPVTIPVSLMATASLTAYPGRVPRSVAVPFCAHTVARRLPPTVE